MSTQTSRIAAATAAAIVKIFSGKTVHVDEVHAWLEFEYAAAGKRTTFGSYVQVMRAVDGAGAVITFGANTSTDQFYTFA